VKRSLSAAVLALTVVLSACGAPETDLPVTAQRVLPIDGSPIDTPPPAPLPPLDPAPLPVPTPTSAWRGMSWRVLGQQGDVVRVGADQVSNVYSGDTDARQELPVLCLKVDGRAVPTTVTPDFYNGWARGEVKLTPKMPGSALTSAAVANQVCANEFGAGWRMAEFHDGFADNAAGGWHWYANGTLDASTRFWVNINDQNANPWNSNGVQEETLIPTTTKVLGEQDRASLLYAVDDNASLYFSVDSPILSSLQVGDTIASRPTPAAPYGLLRKVTAITPNGGLTLVSTDEGILEEAVQNGDMEGDVALDNTNINYALSGAMVAQQSGLQAQKTFNLFTYRKTPFCLYNHDAGRTLDCDDGSASGLRSRVPTTNYLTLDGNLNAQADAFINVKIRWFSLKHFDAGVKLNETASLKLDGKGSYTWDVNKELTQWQVVFNPVTFFIGPVPVVITPMLIPTVGSNGAVNATMHYEVGNTFNARYGVEYDGNNWNTINERTASVAGPSGTTSGTADATVYAGAKGILAFYRAPGTQGAAQVYVHAKPFAQAKASFTSTIGQTAQYSICTHGGVKVDVGIKLPLIRKNPWETQLLEWKRQIGCWQNGQAVTPPAGVGFTSSQLKFTDMYGSVEIYRLDQNTGVGTRIGTMSSNGDFDLAPYLYAVGDTSIRISSIASRSSGVFGSYRRNLDVAVTGNGQVIYDPAGTGCTGCHSAEVYKFTVNKTDGTIHAD
jgi:hypothetical protein